MNVNLNDKKTGVVIIAVIMAVVATSLFLIVKVTPLFVTAYIFALIGIALFCLGTLYLIHSGDSYPWFAAFPLTIKQYLVAQLLLSAIFVVRENVFDASFPLGWFIVMHVALHAFFCIWLLLLHGGKVAIVEREEEVKEKVATLRLMQADAESLLRKFPGHEKDLRPVADALRYSDPMSHASLAPYEERIQRTLLAMGDEGADIPKMCADLLTQIADRNARVKILK
jgi:hypothetical protein